jgi:hypothetical protein
MFLVDTNGTELAFIERVDPAVRTCAEETFDQYSLSRQL